VEYRELHEILRMDTETRVHDAATKLIHQIAFQETRKALDGLKLMGVIGEALAVQLILELNEALIRPYRKEPIQGPTPMEALRLPDNMGMVVEEEEEAEPVLGAPGNAPGDVPRARRERAAKTPGFCPICAEMGIKTELTPGAMGCRAHWREVKRKENL